MKPITVLVLQQNKAVQKYAYVEITWQKKKEVRATVYITDLCKRIAGITEKLDPVVITPFVERRLYKVFTTTLQKTESLRKPQLSAAAT